MATLYTAHDYGDALLQFGLPELSFFVAQLAANLVAECPKLPIDEDSYPAEGSGHVLAQRVRWAPHGMVNAFQEQAGVLYAYAELLVHRPGVAAMVETEVIHLIVDALAAYQEWKTSYCEAQQGKHGAGWGSATGFFKKDWTDLTPKLLALRVPVKAG